MTQTHRRDAKWTFIVSKDNKIKVMRAGKPLTLKDSEEDVGEVTDIQECASNEQLIKVNSIN